MEEEVRAATRARHLAGEVMAPREPVPEILLILLRTQIHEREYAQEARRRLPRASPIGDVTTERKKGARRRVGRSAMSLREIVPRPCPD